MMEIFKNFSFFRLQILFVQFSDVFQYLSFSQLLRVSIFVDKNIHVCIFCFDLFKSKRVMTRFARAKGSKASNERTEEEATSWQELKSQIPQADSKKKHFNVEDLDDLEQVDNAEDVKADHEIEESSEEEEPSNVTLTEIESKENVSQQQKKKRKRNQNKCLNCKEPGHLKKECPQLSETRRQELQDLYQMKIERKGSGTGRKKSKKRKLEEVLNDDQDNSQPLTKEKKRKEKPKSKKVLKDKTGQVVQEGEGLFQGFRVLKEDVARLRNLHAKLEKEKLGAAEMKDILKKERRRAEKALASAKKNVCYHCRSTGHRLNECPNNAEKLGKCYKCGSAEHTSKECQSKLKGADAYRFADCFVCGQTGHLAKACPDNPKGLYPKGGGCRFCGSVEHLKSQCPRKSAKDAKNNVTAQKIASSNIEDEVDFTSTKKLVKKPNKGKVVNF